ncbi:GNAT family N-acetyltransferase [Acinetobacter sp. 194]|uniref:GNAT family N-acetyltransferase n=1 Tax=Acinetobacter shaoyimingii TaxID=2715164 RepID=UPI0014094DBB|nr:GNAT family N-acetyltransferase [Acinetobacter shaoyimingii]NHB56433.1 GNAT family N-acetyltransferase [Acinetobacter shaoyimingii]
MQIRQAIAEDALQIARVHVQSWHETYSGIVHQHILNQLNAHDKARLWSQVLKDDQQHILVFEENSEIKGFADFYFNAKEQFGEIRAIYLLKMIHGRGIGLSLMQQGFKWFQQHDCQKIYVDVFDQNPSRFFYERFGAKSIHSEDAKDYGDTLKIVRYELKI